MKRFPTGYIPGYLQGDFREDLFAGSNSLQSKFAIGAGGKPEDPFHIERAFDRVLGPQLQCDLGSCVVQAASNAIRYNMLVRKWGMRLKEGFFDVSDITDIPPMIATVAAYYVARAAQGTKNEDSGLMPPQFWATMRKYGFGPVGIEWPNDEKIFKKPPSPGYHQIASAFSASLGGPDSFRYAEFDTSPFPTSDDRAKRLQLIIDYLNAGWPVNAGFILTDSFMRIRDDSKCLEENIGDIEPWSYSPKDTYAGRHYLTLCSYHPAQRAFGVLNSWYKWGYKLTQDSQDPYDGNYCGFALISEDTVLGESCTNVAAVLAAAQPIQYGGLYMNTRLLFSLAVTVMLFASMLEASCVPPNPPPPPSAANCDSVCSRMRTLGCKEGSTLANGRKCEEVCKLYSDPSAPAGWNLDCMASVASCGEVMDCGR